MKIKTIIGSVLAIGLLTGGLTTSCLAKEGEGPEAKAKISKAQAVKTIHKLWREGKIKATELEKENGKLIWSFDIALPDSEEIIEAQIDAITGKVVSVEIETPTDQEKEAPAEVKEGKEGKKALKEAEGDDDQGARKAKKEGKEKKTKKDKKAKKETKKEGKKKSKKDKEEENEDDHDKDEN